MRCSLIWRDLALPSFFYRWMKFYLQIAKRSRSTLLYRPENSRIGRNEFHLRCTFNTRFNESHPREMSHYVKEPTAWKSNRELSPTLNCNSLKIRAHKGLHDRVWDITTRTTRYNNVKSRFIHRSRWVVASNHQSSTAVKQHFKMQ